MRKILAMAAAAALAAGVSASAANPFSDVPASDWAYQAVADLSDQGIVEGYPDGTFRGQTNITRYEMAQIVGRLMAKEDQYSAEQRAAIDKLAGEYADDLDSLGVRVSNLEKKVGNISWSGDSRMRYIHSTTDGKWDGRIRITMNARVNDSTTVTGRLTTGNVRFDNGGSDANVKMDRLNVNHRFGDNVNLMMGRYEIDMGTQATWLAGSAFDGAEAKVKLGDASSLAVGFGRFKDADPDTETDTFNEAEAFYAQAKTDISGVKFGVDYFRTSDFTEYGDRTSANVIGANLTVPMGDFRVFGDYYKDTDAPGDPQIWTAGVGYGQMNRKKPGTFGIDIAYFDVEKGLYHQYMTGLDVDDSIFLHSGNFWLATGDVTLMPNLFLHGEYAFAYDYDDGYDPDDAWELSLVYKF